MDDKHLIISSGPFAGEIIEYFNESGIDNTDKVIEIVYKRLKEGDIRSVVVASSSGVTGLRFAKKMAGETNLVITSLAKFEFNVPRTITRVNIPKNAWLFVPEMGVDVALNQADLIAHLIAEEMSLGDMMTLLKLRKGQYSKGFMEPSPKISMGKEIHP
jgi:hypothetical protein